MRGRNPLRDLNSKPGRHTMVRTVPAVRDPAVQVLAVVGACEMVRAVVLMARRALVTAARCVSACARFALGTDAYSIADLEVAFGLIPNPHHRADNLVAYAAGVDRWALVIVSN